MKCRRRKGNGEPMRSIQPVGDRAVGVIDQRALPYRLQRRTLASSAEVIDAIRSMTVRGAPLIGVTGAYGLARALRADPSTPAALAAHEALAASRPTAVNLRWALDRVRDVVLRLPPAERGDGGGAGA